MKKPEIDFPARRLSRRDFRSALRKGQGRAYLYVSRFGLDSVNDIVLEACLHEQRYDLGDSWASWLFGFFEGSAHYARFRAVILAALATTTEEWDLDQLFGLVTEMAVRGDMEAHRLVVDRARKDNTASDPDGAQYWVRLGGAAAVLELALIWGRRLLCNPDEDVPWTSLLPNGTDWSDFAAALKDASEKTQEVKAFWEYLKEVDAFNESPRLTSEEGDRKRREEFRSRHSLKSILDKVQHRGGDRYSPDFQGFGIHATQEERKEIYDKLLIATDNGVRLRLLSVFRRAPLPGLDQRIFDWAEGKSRLLRMAATQALRWSSDERVHDLARSKAAQGRLTGADRFALHLFQNNYDERDSTLIAHAVSSIKAKKHEIHGLGLTLTHLSQEHRDRHLADALRWVYEKTPCQNCRFWAARELDALGQLDGALAYECQFDVDEETRKLGKAWIARNSSVNE